MEIWWIAKTQPTFYFYQVSAWGETHAGLEQYSINKFAEALEVVPRWRKLTKYWDSWLRTLFARVLAENSGVKPKEVIAKLYAAHSEGKTNMGFDIEGDSGEIKVLWSKQTETEMILFS